jgi:putative DNA-invertase from lambdoid prophage Rac
MQKYAIAYMRVSTGEQTVQTQKIAITKWAKEHDYQMLYFFEDPSVSGKIPATCRKGFQDLIEFVRISKVEAVLVYELSRVGRTFWDTLDAIKVIEEHSPLISSSPKESFLQTTDPSIRKLMISILTWVAEREREMLVQRTKDGMNRARIAGKEIGRPEKVIDKNNLITLLAKNISKAKIAREMGISKATLYKEFRRLNIHSNDSKIIFHQ